MFREVYPRIWVNRSHIGIVAVEKRQYIDAPSEFALCLYGSDQDIEDEPRHHFSFGTEAEAAAAAKKFVGSADGQS